jgi:hypothetical protein
LSMCENITIGISLPSGRRMQTISSGIDSRRGIVRIFFARFAGGSI